MIFLVGNIKERKKIEAWGQIRGIFSQEEQNRITKEYDLPNEIKPEVSNPHISIGELKGIAINQGFNVIDEPMVSNPHISIGELKGIAINQGFNVIPEPEFLKPNLSIENMDKINNVKELELPNNAVRIDPSVLYIPEDFRSIDIRKGILDKKFPELLKDKK